MYDYNAVVTEVVDGDTIRAVLDVGFGASLKIESRLLGIDTPETHGWERPVGLAVAGYVRRALLGKPVVIHTFKDDSFGRWLGLINLDGADFCSKLVLLGLALPYDGKAKPDWIAYLTPERTAAILATCAG